jgi:hypothetical protein
MQKIPMTVEGEAALRIELEKLKKEDRPTVIQAIAEAREHGDLKENAEYHAAREQQGFIEGTYPRYRIKAFSLSGGGYFSDARRRSRYFWFNRDYYQY